MNDAASLALFQQAILKWFAIHRRPLPWREDYTPYRTWIAEVMMQQTQMDRGVVYFQRWMERFPDIASVAVAPEEDLLKAWEGLGYYRRVRNIQAAARAVMERHGGVFPEDHAAILALPGIGPYTAGAIASTAFNQEIPCVDGNVERVLSRVFNIATPVRQEPARGRILRLARDLIPTGQARDFNQALMELGALVCRKTPACPDCPLRETCESRRLGIAETRPVPPPRAAIIRVDMAAGVLTCGGRVFVQRRKQGDVWGGLWEFPGGCVEPGEKPEQAVVREWREETGFATRVVKPLEVIRHAYTNHRVTLHAFLLELEDSAEWPPPPVLTEAEAWQWLPIENIADIPLPAPHRKLAEACPVLGGSTDEAPRKHPPGRKTAKSPHAQFPLPGLA